MRDADDAGMARPFLVPVLFGVLGLGLLGGAAWAAMDTIDLRQVGERVPGRIVSYTESRDEDGTSYAPVYEFRFEGETRRHEANVSTSTVPDVGDTRTLIVDPRDPTRVKPDTFIDQWLIPLVLGGVGFTFDMVAFIALLVAVGRRRRTQTAPSDTLGTPRATRRSARAAAAHEQAHARAAASHDDDHADHDPFVGDDDPTSRHGPFL